MVLSPVPSHCLLILPAHTFCCSSQADEESLTRVTNDIKQARDRAEQLQAEAAAESDKRKELQQEVKALKVQLKEKKALRDKLTNEHRKIG